ncbi:MAG: DUF1302 family protein [Bacteroidales bacterium]
MRALIFLLFFIAGTVADLTGQSITGRINGFVRSGLYGELYKNNEADPFSSVYADAGLRLDLRNDYNLRAYADVRYRYGSEFRQNVSALHLREAWISVYGKNVELVMGQRIIKWGRADFDNPVSSFNPRNLVVRSPEAADMDMGNIAASLIFKPAAFLSLEGTVTPFYRSDVLITTPLNLSESVHINQIKGLLGGKSMAGYGVKLDFYLRSIDFSVSWFNGNDPLPAIRFENIDVNIGEETVDFDITLNVTPYRISRFGADFEAVAGRFGLRGEASYTKPELSFRDTPYVPMPEVKWSAGADIMLGDFLIGAEYIGKYITDFEASPVDPVPPGDMPPLTPDQIAMIPGGIDGYTVMQITAFNRLYMYQLERSYHSVGMRVEADMAAGRVSPGLVTLYNFTSGDLAMVPSVKYRPSDGVMIIGGADIYKGREGSLYDIIDRPLTNLFLALRVDF